MIDLNEIEVAARKPWYCRTKQEDSLLRSEILVELITRLREAEKDAARYRWLRDVGQHKYYVDDILGCILHGADGSVDYHMNRNDDE
jgi:hypothetical protein